MRATTAFPRYPVPRLPVASELIPNVLPTAAYPLPVANEPVPPIAPEAYPPPALTIPASGVADPRVRPACAGIVTVSCIMSVSPRGSRLPLGRDAKYANRLPPSPYSPMASTEEGEGCELHAPRFASATTLPVTFISRCMNRPVNGSYTRLRMCMITVACGIKRRESVVLYAPLWLAKSPSSAAPPPTTPTSNLSMNTERWPQCSGGCGLRVLALSTLPYASYVHAAATTGSP